nr:hypothetical protein CFP56_64565 [Quercus suber]
MDVTLALATATTVGMVDGVHGDTAHGGADVEPAAATGFAELAKLPAGVAGDADGGAGVAVDAADLAALQAHRHVLDALDLAAPDLLLRHDGRVGAGAAAEDRFEPARRAHAVHLRAQRHHVHRQAVAAERRLGRQHTRIDNPAHARHQVARDAREERLDRVARAHALGRDDVTFLLRLHALHQRQVRRPVRVVFDPQHGMFPGFFARIVDRPDAPPMAAAAMPHHHSPATVAPALAMSDLGKGQRRVRFAFPEMVVDGAAEMALSRCEYFRLRSIGRGLLLLPDRGGIGVSEGGQERMALATGRSYSWSQHDRDDDVSGDDWKHSRPNQAVPLAMVVLTTVIERNYYPSLGCQSMT